MSGTRPKVTVLMATYNRARLLDAAVESVRVQDFSDWELVIADDGSADETPRKIAEWQEREPRIVYVRSAVNQGISKNYNQGLRVARGEYIAVIDDDDPWLPADKLSKQVAFLDAHPDYVACGGGMVVADLSGKEIFRYLKPEKDEEIHSRMLLSNPVAHSTSLYRASLAREVGGYDESLRFSCDWDFWLKAGQVGKLYNFPEYFGWYTLSRSHNSTVSNMRAALAASLALMQRYRGKYPHYALALWLVRLQYAYSFLPASLRLGLHASMLRLKRLLFK